MTKAGLERAQRFADWLIEEHKHEIEEEAHAMTMNLILYGHRPTEAEMQKRAERVLAKRSPSRAGRSLSG